MISNVLPKRLIDFKIGNEYFELFFSSFSNGNKIVIEKGNGIIGISSHVWLVDVVSYRRLNMKKIIL